jgi:hypothetical protein
MSFTQPGAPPAIQGPRRIRSTARARPAGGSAVVLLEVVVGRRFCLDALRIELPPFLGQSLSNLGPAGGGFIRDRVYAERAPNAEREAEQKHDYQPHRSLHRSSLAFWSFDWSQRSKRSPEPWRGRRRRRRVKARFCPGPPYEWTSACGRELLPGLAMRGRAQGDRERMALGTFRAGLDASLHDRHPGAAEGTVLGQVAAELSIGSRSMPRRWKNAPKEPASIATTVIA